MSRPPLISVCMPVYNAERFVGEAVESILSQTLGDFELLIEDNSTDGTPGILRRYAERDPRIRLDIRPKRGMVTALNALVDQARGEFIARMDGDDIALPERFARQVEYLRAHPDCVLVGSRVRLIDPEGDPLCDWCEQQDHEAIDGSFLRGEVRVMICHPSVMMRRQALLDIGKYRDLRILEDVDLFLRMAERGRVANLPEALLKYRIHEANNSNTETHLRTMPHAHWELSQEARRRRGLPPLPEPPEEGPARTRRPIDELMKWAWWALGSGHVMTARKHARRVAARAPFSPDAWRLMYCTLRGW